MCIRCMEAIRKDVECVLEKTSHLEVNRYRYLLGYNESKYYVVNIENAFKTCCVLHNQ